MLADHIVAEGLGLLYVVAESFIRGGGVQAVRPPALVQRTKFEIRLAVETQAFMTSLIDHFLYLPQGAIAFHFVNNLSVALQGELNIVQIGIFGTPLVGILREQHHGLAHGGTFLYAGSFTILYAHINKVSGLGTFHPREEGEGRCIRTGNGLITGNARFRGRGLQPYGLPDAAHRRVPDALGTGNLLAARLFVVVRSINYLHQQFLLALLQVGGNIKGESRKAARMRAHILAVHPHFRAPVHRLEIEPDLLLFPLFGNGERGAVPQGILFRDVLPYTGKGRFNGKRNQDFSIGLLGADICIPGGNHIVPEAVERLPGFPFHLRTGIFRQRIGRIYIGRPRGQDVVRKGRPGKGFFFLLRAGQGKAQHK